MNSLALRLFLSASVWIIFTLFSGGLLLSNVFRESTQKAFEDKLNFFMETLIGASRVDSTSSITVVSELGDPRFFRPYSGWYWQINEKSKTLVRSRSMWDQVFTLDKRLIGGRAKFIDEALRQTTQNNPGVSSQNLVVIQREISFPGMSTPITFMVSGNTNEFEKNILRYNNILVSSLVLLGLGLFVSVFLQVKYGLLPLEKIKNSLFKIRNGDATKLEDIYPTEVSPLAKEINTLLDHNEKIISRAKMNVGNLAHALKTPVAVIKNHITAKKNDDVIDSQMIVIENYINKYLQKARASATSKLKKTKIDITEVIKKMRQIFKKINPELKIIFKSNNEKFLIAGSEDDIDEIIGNVMENACKWTKTQVIIEIFKISKDQIKLCISDDGPGLPEKKMKEVFDRGFRLDEQTQGTGLGLNIVKDAVKNFSGSVWLEKSKFGGLKVNIIFILAQ
ncbi:HAMP domain-containing histidine kinase [Alphaproteobacteria bacterium]|nr:HAMP domain-containing histidine kinase [Alphaproteobacteria bacterium]